MRVIHATLSALLAWLPAGLLAQQEVQAPRLLTRWGRSLDRSAPHKEYPRPGLRRDRWQSLNGSWDYGIVRADAPRMEKPDGRILVPFPVESWLSGVRRRLDPEHRLDYRRSFKVPDHDVGQRVLLHFEAVDWQATVHVDGVLLGTHRGGYDPFTFDITDVLARSPGATEALLDVSVLDPTDRGSQPRGKQTLDPRGIWYTPSSGIWQSVWLEVVPATWIRDLSIDASFLEKRITLGVELGPAGAEVADVRVRVSANLAGARVVQREGPAQLPLVLPVADPRPWSPNSPTLYDLHVELLDRSGKVLDTVASYCGLRDIAVGTDNQGHRRLFLNGQPLYQHGPLDQGFWPDGLYTAPGDAALRYDLEVTKKLGFNMVRKHVKVEPRRWYHHCDKLGLLVWQDMPSGGAHAPFTSRPGQREIQRDKASARQFESELQAMIRTHRRHPCIVMWVPFNEGWGQYDTQRIAKLVKTWDPSRLVDCASGWNDFPVGDVQDIHRYPGPGIASPRQSRATVLGEFGGLGLPVAGHTWEDQKNWGYRRYADKPALETALLGLMTRLPLLVADGLAASVYTQTTDVESEVNGLMTYDRLLKVDARRLRDVQTRLYGPPARLVPILATSQRRPQVWSYTMDVEDQADVSAPVPTWAQPGFDDAAWKRGPAGFGTEETPGAHVGTRWSGKHIRIRRSFSIDDPSVENLCIRIHHDEDADVFLNGERVLHLEGYTTGYALHALPARARLIKGRNVLALRCRQTGGGQYIDAGLVDCRKADGQQRRSDRDPIAPALPITVFLLRHAEKVDDGRDPGLTEAGLHRATALADLLRHAGVTHLFASEYQRTKATLGPLSRATGLRITEISARSPAKQVLALTVLPPGSVAVVVGHSNTIPTLCKLLAPAAWARNPRPRIEEGAYDRLFMVTIPAGRDRGASTPQCLELGNGDRGR